MSNRRPACLFRDTVNIERCAGERKVQATRPQCNMDTTTLPERGSLLQQSCALTDLKTIFLTPIIVLCAVFIH